MGVESLPYIPAWRGDETLYSWCAWLHRLRGYGPPRETGRALLDAAHAYKDYGAPSKIQHFCEVTENLLGCSRSVLLERTVLAAYYPFLRHAQRTLFDSRVDSPERTSWFTRFGMCASGLDSVATLWWCPRCAFADIQQWGIARWRLPHQLPGAWWCITHECLLVRHQPQNAQWATPPMSQPLQQYGAQRAERHAPALQAISMLAMSLIGTSSIDLSMLKRAILASLREQGVITNGKPLSPSALRKWFNATQTSLAIPAVEPTLAERLSSDWVHEALLRRRVSHPLLWMILWAAARANDSMPDLVHGFLHPEARLSWQEDGQGILWIESDLRGDASVQQVVMNAQSVQDAAQRLKVSPTAVRKYLRKVQCSAASRYEREQRKIRQAKAVEEIQHFLRSSPQATRGDVHRYCSAAVSWLRRWNGERLDELLAGAPEARPRQRELFPETSSRSRQLRLTPS